MGFSKIKAVKKGFERLKEDPLIITGITLVAVVYWVIPFYIIRFLLGVNELLGSLLVLIILPAWFLILIGYMKAITSIYDEETANLQDLFLHYERLPDFLICFLFYFLSVGAGLFLFIIPGIILFVKLSFCLLFILQGEGSAIKAIKKSWKVTGGNFFNILIFYLLLLIFNLLGFLLIGLGVLITVPVSFMAVIFVYRELFNYYTKKEIREVSS